MELTSNQASHIFQATSVDISNQIKTDVAVLVKSPEYLVQSVVPEIKVVVVVATEVPELLS